MEEKPLATAFSMTHNISNLYFQIGGHLCLNSQSKLPRLTTFPSFSHSSKSWPNTKSLRTLSPQQKKAYAKHCSARGNMPKSSSPIMKINPQVSPCFPTTFPRSWENRGFTWKIFL